MNNWVISAASFRYAQYGEVSPKLDVYAFGVVLFELISAKAAIVRESRLAVESKGLVTLVRSFHVFATQNFDYNVVKSIIYWTVLYENHQGVYLTVIKGGWFYFLCSYARFLVINHLLEHIFLIIMQFEEVLNQPDPNEIGKLVDPRLGNTYPLESVHQVRNRLSWTIKLMVKMSVFWFWNNCSCFMF